MAEELKKNGLYVDENHILRVGLYITFGFYVLHIEKCNLFRY